MRRPPKKEEKRGKQTLLINLSIAILITFVISIVLFDAFKPEKISRISPEIEVKAQSQEIPRTKANKAKRKTFPSNETRMKEWAGITCIL